MKDADLVRNALRNHPSPENIAIAKELGIILPKRPRAVRVTQAEKARATWDSEDQFTAAVFAHIAARWPHLMAFHVPNENAHRRPGVLGGVPDVVICGPRGVLFIELKVTRQDGTIGELSGQQVKVIEMLRRLEHQVEVVTDDLDRVIEIIGDWTCNET